MNPRAKFVGLHGHSGVGKDLAARSMAEYGYRRFAFADQIRRYLEHTNPRVAGSLRVADLVDLYGWDVAKRHRAYGAEVRRLMQKTGETLTGMFGESVLIGSLEHAINTTVISDQPRGIVIADVRLPIEAEWVHSKGGVVYKLTRPGSTPVNDHVTERALPDDLVDAVIVNDGSVDDLASSLALFSGNQRPALSLAVPLAHTARAA